jgi:transmembrane sensor
LEITNENIDDLIAKYLSGEALPEEAILLDDWKQLSEDNMRYFTESSQAFDMEINGYTNTQELFRKVLSQIEVPEKKQAKVINLQTYFTPLRIAASLLVVSIVGIVAVYVMRSSQVKPDTILASAEKTQKQQLADGSQVFLNKHAKLTVVGGFNGKERKVKLEGEAFFEVVHNDEKPFVIDAGGVQIKDIGTAFNVKANPQSDSVMVFVTEGTVSMTTETIVLELHENQSAVYIRSTQQLTEVHAVSSNIASYKTRVFHFRATTLHEVIATLNEVYGDLITLENNTLANCRITVDFNNESPETLLSIITETLGLTYEKTSTGYVIKGTSCIQ